MTDAASRSSHRDRAGAEDEIDLADLVAVLYRRWWLIAASVVLMILLVLVWTLAQTEDYQARTLLELGEVPSEEGFSPAESGEAARNRLESLAMVVAGSLPLRQDSDKGQDDLAFSADSDVRFEVPEQGDVVRIVVTAPRQSRALEFLDRLSQAFIEDHSRILSRERQRISADLQRKELAASRLSNRIDGLKREHRKRQLELETDLEAVNAEIEDLEAEQALLNEELELLAEEGKGLKQRLKTIRQRFDELLKARAETSNPGSSLSPIASTLLTGEVPRYLDGLRQRALFEIPQRKGSLRKQATEATNAIAVKQAEKKALSQGLANLDPELGDAIQDLKSERREHEITIEELQERRASMVATTVAAEPAFSGDKISPRLRLRLALGGGSRAHDRDLGKLSGRVLARQSVSHQGLRHVGGRSRKGAGPLAQRAAEPTAPAGASIAGGGGTFAVP